MPTGNVEALTEQARKGHSLVEFYYHESQAGWLSRW